MAQAHKGRPPRLTWRDLKVEYYDPKRGLIQEVAKMKGWDGPDNTPIWWEFTDMEGRIIKISLSGLPRPKLGEEDR
jgi:hypothetical protein